jgi:tellurite resistance protein TehA-like permease
MIAKAKSGLVNAIYIVVILLFFFGLIKWAQANPAEWQRLVNNIVTAAIAITTAVLNAIVGALPQ